MIVDDVGDDADQVAMPAEANKRDEDETSYPIRKGSTCRTCPSSFLKEGA